MRIRVVSWNVDSRPTGLLDAKVDLLRQLRPDFALLQEIGRPVYRALLPHPSAHERMHRRSRVFAWGALSTDLCNPRASEYRLGCAVLGLSGTVLLDAQVLDRAPFEVRDPVRPGFLWRTVAARAALSTGDLLTVCSFHGRQPSGQPAAALQRAFHTGIAGWLTGVPGPVVFGIDAGPPALEGTDPLLGPGPTHHLYPVLRAGNDHLWATLELEVLAIECLSEGAAAAGSDHALLLADLELRSP
ncbi:MAG: endonuclease/exonuclease/phosphatase family protein [Pseudonocardiales bacterium]|nr:endonuclease/exonuclease/phosphatase family protein [Pseudonocardiales bacterium]